MADKVIPGIPLRCSACGLPFARIQNGVLIIESKHHGQTHVNAVSLMSIVELAGLARHGDKSDS